jgi:hypothetical protein
MRCLDCSRLTENACYYPANTLRYSKLSRKTKFQHRGNADYDVAMMHKSRSLHRCIRRHTSRGCSCKLPADIARECPGCLVFWLVIPRISGRWGLQNCSFVCGLGERFIFGLLVSLNSVSVVVEFFILFRSAFFMPSTVTGAPGNHDEGAEF